MSRPALEPFREARKATSYVLIMGQRISILAAVEEVKGANFGRWQRPRCLASPLLPRRVQQFDQGVGQLCCRLLRGGVDEQSG